MSCTAYTNIYTSVDVFSITQYARENVWTVHRTSPSENGKNVCGGGGGGGGERERCHQLLLCKDIFAHLRNSNNISLSLSMICILIFSSQVPISMYSVIKLILLLSHCNFMTRICGNVTDIYIFLPLIICIHSDGFQCKFWFQLDKGVLILFT